MSYNIVVMFNFGKTVHEERKSRGWTQSELAKKSGVSVSYISTIEREQPHSQTGAKLRPEPEVIKGIAKALDLDIDDALIYYGYAPEKKSETDGWFKGLDKLSPEDQKRAKRQIRAIIDSYIDDEEKEEDFDYI